MLTSPHSDYIYITVTIPKCVIVCSVRPGKALNSSLHCAPSVAGTSPALFLIWEVESRSHAPDDVEDIPAPDAVYNENCPKRNLDSTSHIRNKAGDVPATLGAQ